MTSWIWLTEKLMEVIVLKVLYYATQLLEEQVQVLGFSFITLVSLIRYK